jgi:hypothetical protein
MKRNLASNNEEKDFLNDFEINQLSKLEIREKLNKGASKLV